jgi:hypothetical protein
MIKTHLRPPLIHHSILTSFRQRTATTTNNTSNTSSAPPSPPPTATTTTPTPPPAPSKRCFEKALGEAFENQLLDTYNLRSRRHFAFELHCSAAAYCEAA